MSLSKYKTTIILLIVFIALLAFVYFFERNRANVKEEEIETYKILEFEKEKVKKISFNFNNKETVLEKDGYQVWQIIKPIRYKAREGKIDNVFDEINKMEAEQKFESENLSEFGLKDPSLKISLVFDDDIEKTISFGDQNLEETKIYVKTSDSKEIFLVDAFIKNRLKLDEEVLKED